MSIEGQAVESLRDKGGDLFEETRKRPERTGETAYSLAGKGRAEHLTGEADRAKQAELEYVKCLTCAKLRDAPITPFTGKAWLSCATRCSSDRLPQAR
jgi:hypothetical protein